MDDLFVKIVAGEIPSHRIYEDELTYAFLDIHPVKPGHTLVITKERVSTFEQLDEELYLALMKTVRLIARKIKKELQPTRVGVIIEGFEVPHVHVKLIPIDSEQELRQQVRADEPDHDALAAMANQLKIN